MYATLPVIAAEWKREGPDRKTELASQLNENGEAEGPGKLRKNFPQNDLLEYRITVEGKQLE